MKKMSKTTKVLLAVLAVVVAGASVMFAVTPDLLKGQMKTLLPAYDVKPPVFRGDYTVSLAKKTPAATTVVQGQQNIHVATYEFYAKKDVVLKEMSFKIGGLINPTKVKAIRVTDALGNVYAIYPVDAYGYSVVSFPGTILAKNKYTNIKVYADLSDDVASASTFSVGIASLKLTNFDAGNNAIGSYNLNKLVGSTFNVISSCKFAVKEDFNLAALYNGNDVGLLNISISSTCTDGLEIEDLTFHLNFTKPVVKSLHFYDSYGIELDKDSVITPSEYDTIDATFNASYSLPFGNSTSYVLTADIENATTNDKVWVELNTLVLRNKTTNELYTLTNGNQFTIDNLLSN